MLEAEPPTTNIPVWAWLGASSVPLIISIFGFIQASKANSSMRNVDNKKVDAEAYKTAKEFYEAMLNERRIEAEDFTKRINSLQRQVNEMQQQLNKRIQVEDGLREDLRELQGTLSVVLNHNADHKNWDDDIINRYHDVSAPPNLDMPIIDRER